VQLDKLTRVEDVDGAPVRLKRDDTFWLNGASGGKARAVAAIVQDGMARGLLGGRGHPGTLVTAGLSTTPQAPTVARVAEHYGLASEVWVPATAKPTAEVQAAAMAGATVRTVPPIPHRTVLVARAKAAAQRPGHLLVPYDVEHQLLVKHTARQVANVPRATKRIVVPVGSGMALAGILHGLATAGRTVPVLGIVVGNDPGKRLDRWAPPWWRQMVELRQAHQPYQEALDDVWVGTAHLDPIYEAKCAEWLRPGDLLWVVGRRSI
jgi:1-aminocyclopropane-1-carboxylate deaminase/D-cysteine desulfhydrase-like pyridoxal-dependent ACC family enzyme